MPPRLKKMMKKKMKSEALAVHVDRRLLGHGGIRPGRGPGGGRASRRLPVILSRGVLPGRGAGGACSRDALRHVHGTSTMFFSTMFFSTMSLLMSTFFSTMYLILTMSAALAQPR